MSLGPNNFQRELSRVPSLLDIDPPVPKLAYLVCVALLEFAILSSKNAPYVDIVLSRYHLFVTNFLDSIAIGSVLDALLVIMTSDVV